MSRFSEEVESSLRIAGWQPGRQVDLVHWRAAIPGFSWHAAAEVFLREFGGLRVDLEGPGIARARESFEFDPELAVGEEERFSELSKLFGRNLFPLGALGNGDFFLAMAAAGGIDLLGAWVFRGGVGDLALENLVAGVAPERLAPPA